MNTVDEILETGYIKSLTLVIFIIPFVLDALGKTEYYFIAFIVAAFIVLLSYLDVKKRQKLYETEVLPIPIVVSIEPNVKSRYILKNLFSDLEKKTNLKDLQKNLQRYRNITDDELIFNYNGDLYDKERIISFMQIVRYQIAKIKENTSNQVEFHLAYHSRPAFGFFLGYIFAQEDLVVYQQTPDKDRFDRVATLEKRDYKNEVDHYTKFRIEQEKEDPNSKEALLAIKASSHYIKFNSPSLQNYTHIVSMVANHNGTIADDEDWVLYAREIFTQLQTLQNSYEKVTIVHNLPESLAIIVGRATGNFWSTMITQYDRGEYKEIMQLDDLKCYF